MTDAILIIAPEPTAEPIAEALRHSLKTAVEVAPHRRAGLAALRRGEFSLVLMEEALAGVDPEGADLLYQNAGSAPLLEVNLAISGAPRIVRQARAALARRAHDHAQARSAAARSLQHELGAALTGMLLESQLALREAPPPQAARLERLVELARDLRGRLLEQPR
jgi:hypothetical protein